jgi:tetrahydromethanopterin S-methyltransferase subunit A
LSESYHTPKSVGGLTELRTREKVDEVAGKICKVVIPIKKEYYVGQGKSLAICTLSSLDLLEKISQTPFVMGRVAIVGRLLSENKGIDAIVKFAAEHPDLSRLILCGKEVKGHKAGQALLSLAANGTDNDGRIIGALGSYPTLRMPSDVINAFRRRVVVEDLIGTTDVDRIVHLVA